MRSKIYFVEVLVEVGSNNIYMTIDNECFNSIKDAEKFINSFEEDFILHNDKEYEVVYSSDNNYQPSFHIIEEYVNFK